MICIEDKKRGFTLIEILIILAIIGILGSIVLISTMPARDTAIVQSYKTSMKSLRTAFELCAGTGGTVVTGTRLIGQNICTGGHEVYPDLPRKCKTLDFEVIDNGGDAGWSVTTTNGLYCAGCRMVCTVHGCSVGDEESVGACVL